MLKINYPEDRAQFNQDYLNVFNKVFVSLSCRLNCFLNEPGNNALKQVLKQKEYNGVKLNETSFLEYLLIAPIKDLLNIVIKVKEKQDDFWETTNNELRRIFYYGGQTLKSDDKAYISKQSDNIATFFKGQLNISTCYYCNIDYVNAFRYKDYFSKLDFILNAEKKELYDLIEGMGKNSKIFIFREKISNREIKNFEQLIGIIKKEGKGIVNKNSIIEQFKNLDFEKIKAQSQFTLDHLIDKGSYPLLALSLYN
jgi:hypothetical protein